MPIVDYNRSSLGSMISGMFFEAVVVPANRTPIVTDCVQCAIYEAAGYDEVMAERKALGRLEVAQAESTQGFELAEYIIHVVPPASFGDTDKLLECYTNAIKCAEKLGVKRLLFPVLMGYDNDHPLGNMAKSIAMRGISDALGDTYSKKNHNGIRVFLADSKYQPDLYEKAKSMYLNSGRPLEELEQELSELPESENPDTETEKRSEQISGSIMVKKAQQKAEKTYEDELKEYLDKYPAKTAENFNRNKISDYFWGSGLTDKDIADELSCDRSTVYRIRTGITKTPEKTRVIAISIVMELACKKNLLAYESRKIKAEDRNEPFTEKEPEPFTGRERLIFMRCFGYAYPSDAMDFAVENILRNENYKRIDDVNGALWEANPDWLLLGDPDDEASERER